MSLVSTNGNPNISNQPVPVIKKKKVILKQDMQRSRDGSLNNQYYKTSAAAHAHNYELEPSQDNILGEALRLESA